MKKAFIGIWLFSIVLTSCIYRDNIQAYTITPHGHAGRMHALKGLKYISEGRSYLALQELNLAKAEAPNDLIVLQSWGYFYEKMGDLKHARYLYLKTILKGSESPLINDNYGAFLCRNGHPKEAIYYFLKAAKNPAYRSHSLANARLCSKTWRSQRISL